MKLAHIAFLTHCTTKWVVFRCTNGQALFIKHPTVRQETFVLAKQRSPTFEQSEATKPPVGNDVTDFTWGL